MLNNVKALAVILALSALVFVLARPLCLRFMTTEAFARRRNVWLLLTVTAFLSPSFWLYALVAALALYWCSRSDDNPAAVALLLFHVVPPVHVELPAALVNRLFDLSNYRLVALALLVPVALRLLGERSGLSGRRFLVPDLFILGYMVLQLVLLMPYESITNTMRRGFLFGLDSLLVYYVFSRQVSDRRKLAEVFACFVLACGLMSAVAVFESQRSWLLYTGVNEVWGDPNVFSWLFRGEDLRAQSASGHSLALGYLCAMAVGMWLCLQQAFASKVQRLGVFALLIAGLAATIARAPWVVAAATYLVYYALASPNWSSVAKRFGLLALAAAALLVSPYGPGIIERLPFVGTIDAGNVDYRQQLAEMSWELIKQNPFFGSPFVLTHLEALRQGQGIIDLVNSYASIAMFYGLTGLVLFLGLFVWPLLKCLRFARAARWTDPRGPLGVTAAMAGCMVGTLVMMATGSFGTGLALLYWAFAGLAAGMAGWQAQMLHDSRLHAAHTPVRPLASSV